MKHRQWNIAARVAKALPWMALVLVALGLGWVTLVVRGLAVQVEAARSERDALIAQIERLGEQPIVDAPPGEAGPVGDRGPGPSAAEVEIAVATYCAEGGRCRGPAGVPGPRGETGPAPSPDQVASAVRAYCNAESCRGPSGDRGPTGADGTNGADGSDGAQGPQGERGEQGNPPSDDQVAAAVAGYCAGGACRGPEGPQGPAGQDGIDGDDGRGIVDVSDPYRDDAGNCVLTITYDRAPDTEIIVVSESLCSNGILPN